MGEIGHDDEHILTECDGINVAIDLQMFVSRNEEGDNFLVYAWLRHFIGNSDFNSDVVGMIQAFFCTSMLHAFAYDHYSVGRHKAISVDVVLQSRVPLREDTLKALEKDMKAHENRKNFWAT